MKKTLFLIAASLFTAGLSAQTIVSTEKENRNVIIEEFTGVGCGYCPDGHETCNNICQQYAGHAWSINIHQGGYATGSGYETQWGDALASQYNVNSYPNGVVNRGTSATSNRQTWVNQAATVRDQESPLNIAATATIDPTSRQLSVHVEMFYTGSQTATSNYLNVALLQDSVLGPQSNYGAQVQGSPYNSDYVTDEGLYYHMHMLRDLLTGQWGEQITTVDSGTFVSRDYTYTLPMTIGKVDIDFLNMKVIVFVTETHKNVITGNEATMTVLPGAFVSHFDCYVKQDCSLDYHPYVTVRNTFDEAVESWVFNYNGQEITVNKAIAAGGRDTINMPLHSIVVSGAPVQNCATTDSVALVGYTVASGESTTVAPAFCYVSYADFKIYTVEGPFTARLGADAYRTECGVRLIDQSNCHVLWDKMGFGSDISTQNARYISDLPNATYLDFDFSPATAGLYIFRVIDSYGDGWYMTNDDVPSGVWISNAAGQFVSDSWGYTNGPSFSYVDYYLNVTNDGDGSHNVGVDEVENVSFSVYPNPVTDKVMLQCASEVREVSVLDLSGRTLMTLGATKSVDMSGLANGMYIVRVVTDNGIGMQKIVKE